VWHYPSDRILIEHVAKKHEGKSKCQCEDCDKVFTKARELEVHKLDHIDQENEHGRRQQIFWLARKYGFQIQFGVKPK
jgi:hypothetical protein